MRKYSTVMDAVKANDLGNARKLLVNGATFITVEEGCHCLVLAVEKDNSEMVQLLMDFGAKPHGGRSFPAVLAAEKNYWMCLMVITKNYKDVGGKAGYAKALQICKAKVDKDILKRICVGLLILQGPTSQRSPLSEESKREELENCVESACLNMKRHLIWAVEENNHGMVEFLLELGLDPNGYYEIKDGRWYFALHAASGANNLEMVKLLLRFGPVDPRLEINHPTITAVLKNPPEPSTPEVLCDLVEAMDQAGPFNLERLEQYLNKNTWKKQEEKREAAQEDDFSDPYGVIPSLKEKSKFANIYATGEKKIQPYGIEKSRILWLLINRYLCTVRKLVQDYQPKGIMSFFERRSQQSKDFVNDLKGLAAPKHSCDPKEIRDLQERIHQFVVENSRDPKRANCRAMQLLGKHSLIEKSRLEQAEEKHEAHTPA